MEDPLHDKNIRDKIKSLDDVFPKELAETSELWLDLNKRLDKKKRMRSFMWTSAIAASMAFVALIYAIKSTNPEKEHIEITFRTEALTEEPGPEVFEDPKEIETALHYPREQCLMKTPTCASAEFIELQKQLLETDVEIDRIEKQLQVFGSDPAFIKARISVENQRIYLINELIQLTRS